MAGWHQLCSQLGLGKYRNGLQSDQWQENEQTSRDSHCTGSSGRYQPHTWKIQIARAVLGREKYELRAPTCFCSSAICWVHWLVCNISSAELLSHWWHQSSCIKASGWSTSWACTKSLTAAPPLSWTEKGIRADWLHCLNPPKYV